MEFKPPPTPFAIRRSTRLPLQNVSFYSPATLSVRSFRVEKIILDPDPDLDQTRNVIDWSLFKVLSFYKNLVQIRL